MLPVSVFLLLEYYEDEMMKASGMLRKMPISIQMIIY